MEYQRTSLWTIIKRFLLGILFVALIIFLLLWFFPTKNSLNPLLQDVFRNNINSMKDAAETYFTNERMPSEVGEKVKITLGEMLDLNLLLPFTDKNGNSCSYTDSYVEVTKTNTEYEMKVNLSCPTEEAFIIEHLGCIDRCINCNKEEKVEKVEEQQPIIKETTKNKIKEYEFKKSVETKEIIGYTCPEGYTQDKSNSKACYKNIVKLDTVKTDKNTNTSTTNKLASTTTDTKQLVATKRLDTKDVETKTSIVTVDLNEDIDVDIKGTTSKTITDTTNKVATSTTETTNKVANTKTDTTAKVASTKTDTVNKIANTKTDTINATANKKYQYLYEKTTAKEYSEWSNWSEDKEYDPNNNNIVWGEQELVNNAKNGYLKRTITKTQTDTNQPIYNYSYDNLVGTYKQYVCSGYTYFRDQSTSTTYTTTDWSYSKTIKSEKALTSTLTTKYEYSGIDYTSCGCDCLDKPVFTYKVYTRTITPVTKTKTQLSAECNVEEKTINVYGMKKTFAGYVTNKITTDEYVYYYHTKTRTIINAGETLSKWSTSNNDKALINDGYKYTGTYKVVSTTYSCPSGYTLSGDKCTKTITTYSCPSGYTASGDNCIKKTTTYVCPSGYTASGDKCTKTITTYVCPSGYTASGDKCVKNTIEYVCPSDYSKLGDKCIKTNIVYSCPSGYTRSGDKCQQTVSANHCPSGYTKSGETCTKEIVSYSCPSGYTEKNDICTKEITEYSCPSGYKESGDKCVKNTTTYSCPNGYTRSGETCTKEITTKDTKNATAKYKTVNGISYKWSTSKTLSGWTATGRTREIEG